MFSKDIFRNHHGTRPPRSLTLFPNKHSCEQISSFQNLLHILIGDPFPAAAAAGGGGGSSSRRRRKQQQEEAAAAAGGSSKEQQASSKQAASKQKAATSVIKISVEINMGLSECLFTRIFIKRTPGLTPFLERPMYCSVQMGLSETKIPLNPLGNHHDP